MHQASTSKFSVKIESFQMINELEYTLKKQIFINAKVYISSIE